MFVADPGVPPIDDRALDDARRLPGRRRRRGDQPLPRPRARRAHGAHPRPAAGRGPDRAAARPRLRDRARRRWRRSSWRSPSTSLAAALALAGLLGYVFVYTVWLKPLTPQNIVIGGAAGAVPPLVGWAAATGGLALEALWPFGIVFLWTPPHFWALSLLIKDDYARTGVPMLPVVKGEAGDPAPDRRLHAGPGRLHACSRSPPASSAPSTPPPRCVLGGGFIGARRRACCARPSRRARCASTSPRSPTWRCSSARWPSTRVALIERRRGPRPRHSEPRNRPLRRPRSRSRSSASPSSSRSSTSASAMADDDAATESRSS